MKGFTLIEIVLVFALLALIVGFSMPAFMTFQARNDLDTATATVAQDLRRAQVFSRAMREDSAWGVFIDNDNITLFKGDSFNERDEDFDEVSDLYGSVEVGDSAEFNFEKLTGQPQEAGTITLTLRTGEEREITINEQGIVEY